MENKDNISESVLDPVQKTRCKEIFDTSDNMKPEVKGFIEKILSDWTKQINFKFNIESIYMVGSSTGFQYTSTSDVDISLLTDMNEEQNKEVAKILPNGNNIPGTQHPVNFYINTHVKGNEFSENKAENIYEIKTGKWLKKSDKTVNKIPFSYILEVTKFFMNALDLSIGQYERDKQEYNEILKLDPNTEEISEKEKKEAMDQKIIDLKADLDGLRMGNHVIRGFLHEGYNNDIFQIQIELGVGSDPRWSMNNLVYKTLEKYGYREKLDEKIKEAQSLIDSLKEDINKKEVVKEDVLSEKPLYLDDGRELTKVNGASFDNKEEADEAIKNGSIMKIKSRKNEKDQKKLTAVGCPDGKVRTLSGSTPHNTYFEEK